MSTNKDEELRNALFQIRVGYLIDESQWSFKTDELIEFIEQYGEKRAKAAVSRLPKIGYSFQHLGGDTYEVNPERTIMRLKGKDVETYVNKLRLTPLPTLPRDTQEAKK